MRTLAHDSDKAEILARLRTVRPESQRRWGRMSAHQMICHLTDAFRFLLGIRTASSKTNLVSRTLIKWVALYLPLPWPPGIPTRPEVDQERGGTKPVDFATDVAELESLFDRVTAPTSRIDGVAHPLFGSLSRATWLRWGYLHMDHHLRQFGA